MPWKPEDAARHNKKVKSPKGKRQWADVANSVLARTGDEGRAVRTANGVMRREMGKFRGVAATGGQGKTKPKVTKRNV